MIILKKEKILFYITVIVLSIFVYSVNNPYSTTKETSSVPLSNHVIIVDAGHGLPDGGATDSNNNFESTINLKVALKLQKILEASNCTVILTRSDENGIYEEKAETIRNKKVSDMKNRVSIANTSNAEIFVSIHMNKSTDNSSGWQTFYKKDCDKSKSLADFIQQNMNYSIQKENKRTIKPIDNIYLAKHLSIPFALVECGFLSNSEEATRLQDDNYQDELAWGIYTGIMDYFNQ